MHFSYIYFIYLCTHTSVFEMFCEDELIIYVEVKGIVPCAFADRRQASRSFPICSLLTTRIAQLVGTQEIKVNFIYPASPFPSQRNYKALAHFSLHSVCLLTDHVLSHVPPHFGNL